MTTVVPNLSLAERGIRVGIRSSAIYTLRASSSGCDLPVGWGFDPPFVLFDHVLVHYE